MSHSNTSLIQIIPLSFLQEGKKKAPYVQPDEAVKMAIAAECLGACLVGNLWYREGSRAHLHCNHRGLITGLTPQPKAQTNKAKFKAMI